MLLWIKNFFQSSWVVWQKQTAATRTTITLSTPWPVVFSSLAFVMYLFIPLTAVVIVFFSLAGLSFFAWLWAKQMTSHVRAERKLRFAAVQVGDELEETIRLINTGWLPVLWTHLEDNSDFPLYSIRSVRGVDGQSAVEWRNRTICKQRGVFSMGPWSLNTGDPFGIFQVRREYLAGQQIFVYPPLAAISQTLLPHGKQQGDLQPLNQPLAAESLLATHTRPYQPGDPLRRLHWRTTARRNQPYVKGFDPQAVSRIWLVPDLQAAVHCQQGENSSEETMILLLAALAGQLLGEQRAVGLYAAAETPVMVVPQPGPGYIWEILAALTPLHADQSLDFAQVLRQAGDLISQRDLIVVVTPNLSADWMQTLAGMTNSAAGSRAWALLLDPAAFGGVQHAQSVLPVLAGLGITARVVQPEDVTPQEGGYGALRRWEFITTGTGKVVVRNTPRQAGGVPIFPAEEG
jgi:uncharacterized protein (DUF58 family)